MKALTVAALCLLSIISCATKPGRLEKPQPASPFQTTVDTMKALTSQLRLPEYLNQPEAKKQGGEFDVQGYFTVLKHVSMQPGYVLDYVYSRNGMGARPFLYARKEDAPPLSDYAAYETAAEDCGPSESHADSPGDSKLAPKLSQEHRYCRSYLQHVECDGSDEGYLEFVAFRLLAGQFYLVWHAAYDDTVVIADTWALKRLLASGESPGKPFPKDFVRKARSLDVTPSVEASDKSVKVSLTTFTKWGGIERREFTFDKAFPHSIEKEATTTLVGYYCRWVM
ncbi:MAG: hypothetical protein NTW86_05275 [Candidatus Sumerlaeota bacterium]|nr:hypothetical protein [Candidatus Sumerlaeota bacterium]